MRTLQVLTVSILLSISLLGQQSNYIYICPVPGSDYINPQQKILLKATEPFNEFIPYDELIKIEGTIGGNYSFNVKLLDENKLISIQTERSFSYGEVINVKIDSYRTHNGTSIEPLEISFKIKQADNLPLLKEYYRLQKVESYNDNMVKNRVFKPGENTPINYPDPQLTIYNTTTNKNYFLTLSPRAGTNDYVNYLSINDNNGIPIFFRKTDYNTLNFHVLDNGQLTYASNRFGDPELEQYYFMDSSFVVTDSIKTVNGYNMDGHDMLLLENDHFMLMSYDPQTVNMSQIVPGGNPNATVIGLVLQEVDLNGNLYFQWRSWDHFEITDATSDISLTAANIDYVHGNAFEIDKDDNLLLSSRHLDEITKIDMQTGDVIYRLGLLAKNNEFTFVNDNLGFSHQHDVRVLPNGNITIYDNGNLHASQFSRALEYDIDEDSKTATLVWFYRNGPDIYGMATGSYRRDNLGNHLIGWGSTWPIGCTELNPDNSIAAEIEFPDGVYSYRVIKDSWVTNLFTSLNQLNFGNYYEGAEFKMKVIPIANNSNHTIRITSNHLVSDNFTILDPLPIVIPAEDTISVILGFQPPEYNNYSDRLTLNYDRITLSETERIARQVQLYGIWEPTKPIIQFDPMFGETDISIDTEITVSFSEPVRKMGGGNISNDDLENIFEFRKGHQWADKINFTGEIDDEAKVITLYPDEPLNDYSDYYVELRSSMIQTLSGNLINYPEATLFTTGLGVSVSEAYNKPDINVFPVPASKYAIIDANFTGSYNIVIQSANGKTLFVKHASRGRQIIDIEKFEPGCYYIIIETELQDRLVKKLVVI